jgi:putative ABC transport system permease protein
MQHIAELNLLNFGLVYLLLIIVLAIMKKARINQTKLLVIASIRMTVQLVLAGLILTYIFKNPHPLFTAAYLLTMTVFAIHRVLSKNKGLNRNFKIAISASIAGAGLLIVMFFIQVIVGISIFNPSTRYRSAA